LRTPILIFLGFTSACGLTFVGGGGSSSENEAAPTPPSVPAPSSSSSGSNGSTGSSTSSGSITDAGQDAPPNVNLDSGGGGCQVLIADSFTGANPSATWDKLGVAAFGSGQVVLTPKGGSTDSAGAIWWKSTLTFNGSLHVVLDFAIDATNVTAGDGIAVAWVSSAKIYELGDPRLNFGICASGLNGTAVAAQSRASTQKLLVMDSVSGECGTDNGVFSGTVTNATQLVVDIRTGDVTGALSNGLSGSRNDVSLPKTGYFGITASTGDGFASHIVSAVTVMSCP